MAEKDTVQKFNEVRSKAVSYPYWGFGIATCFLKTIEQQHCSTPIEMERDSLGSFGKA